MKEYRFRHRLKYQLNTDTQEHIPRVRSCIQQHITRTHPKSEVVYSTAKLIRVKGKSLFGYFNLRNISVDWRYGWRITLKSLSKSKIIDLFLKMQGRTTNNITSLAEEIKEPNSSFKKFESNVVVSKT